MLADNIAYAPLLDPRMPEPRPHRAALAASGSGNSSGSGTGEKKQKTPLECSNLRWDSAYYLEVPYAFI